MPQIIFFLLTKEISIHNAWKASLLVEWPLPVTASLQAFGFRFPISVCAKNMRLKKNKHVSCVFKLSLFGLTKIGPSELDSTNQLPEDEPQKYVALGR